VTLLSRLGELITAIGADIKRIDADIAALGGGSGGADPWTHQALTALYTNTTVTASNVFAGFTPAANTRYIVDCLLSAYSAATATGIQTGLAGPTTGITAAAVKVSTPLTATTEQLSSIGLNAFSAPGTSLVTPNLILVQAIIETATPGAGNIRLQARSEVAGSAINIRPGSSMRWRTI
jgi:hypothetical protein